MTEKSRHCHMHASSHNSVHLSSWPKSHWATSKGTGRTGPARRLTAFRWTLGDIYHVQRLTVRKWGAVPTPQLPRHEPHNCQSKFSCCQLIMAVRGKEGADPKNNDWPLTIKRKKKKEFGWIMSLDFLTIYWQYHSLFFWLGKYITAISINGNIRPLNKWIIFSGLGIYALSSAQDVDIISVKLCQLY